MANSLKNITIPLTGSLNMNRNESLTDSSFSIFNKQNSPVFGGSISPLHYKLNGTNKAVYTYSGDKFHIVNGILYKNDVALKDLSSEKAFEITNIEEDLDGLEVDRRIGYKIYTDSDGLHLRLYQYKPDWTLRETHTYLVNSDAKKSILLSSRIVQRFDRDFVLMVYLFDGRPVLTVYLVTNSSDVVKRISRGFEFVKPIKAGEFEEIFFTSKSIRPFITMTQQLSKGLDDDPSKCFGGSKTNVSFGISVFQDRPSASNTYADLAFANFEFSFDQTSDSNLFLNVCALKGAKGELNYNYTLDNLVKTSDRSTYMAFVDNSTAAISVGSPADANDWGNFVAFTPNATPIYMSSYPSLTEGNTYYSMYAPKQLIATIDSGSHLNPSKFQSSCLTMNQDGYARLVIAGFGIDDKTPVCSEIFDAITGKRIDGAGVTSNADIPTNSDGWGTWWGNRKNTRDTCYNKTGSRSVLSDSGFCVLYNGEEGNITGISYAKDSSKVGTLLTEWGSVLESFGVSTGYNRVAYKDANTGKIKLIRTKSVETSDLSVVRNKLIVRCSADENIYDLDTGKWGKFANDWNDRCFTGISSTSTTSGEFFYSKAYERQASVSFYSTASFSTGFDSAFQKEKSSTPSRLFAYNQYQGVFNGDYISTGYVLTDINGLDIFISEGLTAPYYKTTKYEHRLQVSSVLNGSVYPVTEEGSTYFNIPVIDFSLLDCYNGRYALTVDESAYSLVMSDRKTPVLLYNALSGVQSTDFFIVQGQNYAVVQDYICMLTYNSNGVITQVEQVVDVGSMTFLGAFPSCALFYSPAAKTIFAFNGDANLQIYVKTDRISEVYTTKYFPALEWICFCCNDGTYILTEDNNFRVELFGVEDFYNTKDPWVTAVLSNGKNIRYSLVKHDSTWTTIPVEVETTFFCDGDMKKSTITDWYIRVFKGDEDYNGKVVCSAKTMNDIVSQTIKTFDGKVDVKLTKDKFDENDNSMITLHTGCNALGTSCKVVSDYPISYFGFTIGGDGSTAKSKYNI